MKGRCQSLGYCHVVLTFFRNTYWETSHTKWNDTLTEKIKFLLWSKRELFPSPDTFWYANIQTELITSFAVFSVKYECTYQKVIENYAVMLSRLLNIRKPVLSALCKIRISQLHLHWKIIIYNNTEISWNFILYNFIYVKTGLSYAAIRLSCRGYDVVRYVDNATWS